MRYSERKQRSGGKGHTRIDQSGANKETRKTGIGQRLAEATDETTYNNTDEEEDEEPEVFAPVPQLRSGFSTASSADVCGAL